MKTDLETRPSCPKCGKPEHGSLDCSCVAYPFAAVWPESAPAEKPTKGPARREYEAFTDVPATHYLPYITLRRLADAALAEADERLATLTAELEGMKQDRALLMEATIHGVVLEALFAVGEWPDGADEYMERLAEWMVAHDVDDGTLDAQKAITRWQPRPKERP